MNPLYVFAGFAAVVVAALVLSSLYEKKRTRALQALAASLKFSFAANNGGAPPALGAFHLFAQGRDRRATNIMQGTASGIDVTLLDYRYTTGSGKHSHTWHQTVIAFRSPLLDLPSFALRPENLFHKVGAVFGYQDIDFASHPSFSGRYLLQGVDEDAVRAVFTNNLLSFYDNSKGLCTEGAGDSFIFYRPSRRVPPERIMEFMREAVTVFGLMKARA